jgi:hypothetical protein
MMQTFVGYVLTIIDIHSKKHEFHNNIYGRTSILAEFNILNYLNILIFKYNLRSQRV